MEKVERDGSSVPCLKSLGLVSQKAGKGNLRIDSRIKLAEKSISIHYCVV